MKETDKELLGTCAAFISEVYLQYLEDLDLFRV